MTKHNRFLSMLLVVTMLVSVFAHTALFTTAAEDVVSIGNVTLHHGEYLANGTVVPTTQKPTNGGYAYYQNGVLTLHDYSYDGNAGVFEKTRSVITRTGDLKLVLEGNSSILNDYYASSFPYWGWAIQVTGDFTLTGAGALTVSACSIINITGSFTMESGTLNVQRDMIEEFVISARGGVTINGGTLTVASALCYQAIYTYGGKVVINGGAVELHAGYQGINAKEVIVNGGTLDVTAYDCCIVANKTTVNSGNVTIKAVERPAFSGTAISGTLTVANNLRIVACEEFDGVLGLYNPLRVKEYKQIVINDALSGDVDGNGRVDSTDARLVLQYVVDVISEKELNIGLADVNGSGRISSTDARLILQYAVKKIDKFPKVE